MITITRQQARRLRGVLRRPVLGIRHRDPIPPVVFRATTSEFRVECQYRSLAVIYIEPGRNYLDDTIALPLEGLADIESSSQAPVQLLDVSPEQIVATYRSAGKERRYEYTVPAVFTLSPFPQLPSDWTPCPASLLVALTTFAKAPGDDTVTDRNTEARRNPMASTLGRMLGGQGLLFGTTLSHLALRSGPWTMLVRHRSRVLTRQRPELAVRHSREENRAGKQ